MQKCNQNIEVISISKAIDKGMIMSSVTVRNLPEEVHRALKARAKEHGRSTEAEIRDILQQAAIPGDRLKLGSLLVSIAEQAGGLTDAQAEQINSLRDKTTHEPMSFE